MSISDDAVNYIKKITKNKKLFEIFANDKKYRPYASPATLFMAGSPGAGKTETSKNIIKIINKELNFHAIRIDADEIRQLCPKYTGTNAHLFQRAASLGVSKLYDYVLKNNFNAVLDGTFSNLKYAVENIERALNRNREILIFYIFQDPKIAWEFTLKREFIEKRKITLDVFIDDFLSARKNVNYVKKKFKEKIRITIIKKNFLNNDEKFWTNVESIDKYIKFEYDKKTLYNQLKDIKV